MQELSDAAAVLAEGSLAGPLDRQRRLRWAERLRVTQSSLPTRVRHPGQPYSSPCATIALTRMSPLPCLLRYSGSAAPGRSHCVLLHSAPSCTFANQPQCITTPGHAACQALKLRRSAVSTVIASQVVAGRLSSTGAKSV